MTNSSKILKEWDVLIREKNYHIQLTEETNNLRLVLKNLETEKIETKELNKNNKEHIFTFNQSLFLLKNCCNVYKLIIDDNFSYEKYEDDKDINEAKTSWNSNLHYIFNIIWAAYIAWHTFFTGFNLKALEKLYFNQTDSLKLLSDKTTLLSNKTTLLGVFTAFVVGFLIFNFLGLWISSKINNYTQQVNRNVFKNELFLFPYDLFKTTTIGIQISIWVLISFWLITEIIFFLKYLNI